jgi:hypothetical protein
MTRFFGAGVVLVFRWKHRVLSKYSGIRFRHSPCRAWADARMLGRGSSGAFGNVDMSMTMFDSLLTRDQVCGEEGS